MQSASYVVHLIGCDDDPPFKHFGARADAVEHGRSEVQSGNAELANIYEVAGTDGVAAIALWQAGNATHTSDSEIETANQRAWDTAQKAGSYAVLKYLELIPRDAPDPPTIKRRKF
jgi:hypothetical protein